MRPGLSVEVEVLKVPPMRLGCYGSLDQASRLKAAGFDFIEVDAQPVLRADLPSSDWDRTAPDTGHLPLPIEAASHCLPAGRPVIGPERDMTGLQNVMQRVAKRAQRLGIGVLIFNVGETGDPSAPVDAKTARVQLEEFVRMAGQVCAHHGVTLAIEAGCGDQASNPMNRLDEVKSLCDRVEHRCVGVAVDSRCLGLDGQDDEAVLSLGDRLRYVRLTNTLSAAPLTQQAADPGVQSGLGIAGESDMEYLFCLLHKAGYDGPITIGDPWLDATHNQVDADGVRLLRAAWGRSGGFDD